MPPNFSIDGASNFRALPYVRQGSLYRSDHLGALDEADARQIQSLGIRRVLDLRGVDERVSAECLVPDVTVHSLAIEPTIVQVLRDLMAAGHKLTAAEVAGHMQDTYRGFVRHNSYQFAQLFRHLLESNEPTVFHCTAGKDRTGFAAALILRSLGVGEEDVMRDYLLTNDRLRMPDASRFGLAPEVAAVLWRVQPEFLKAAFEAVDEEYGGLEGYFRKGLGLGDAERKRMRDLYLPL
ncbi:tyrosine-protein phosphatase [Caenimonas soli]|uniref:tyrosine-protein phosphatase n=1 Tax=Caenimonas soli TaxID=2735555 RepID=UPI001552797B|nr:tyrosine-protein phosphatase [Caenimonas soli]NPC55490.1 tyrosine-protein phosphatase [Caenimonas soli]